MTVQKPLDLLLPSATVPKDVGSRQVIYRGACGDVLDASATVMQQAYKCRTRVLQ